MQTTALSLTSERFETGLPWGTYLAGMNEHRETSTKLYESARVADRIVGRFGRIVDRHGGHLSISAMTEQWCGDSAVTLPMVARLSEAVPHVEFRVLTAKRFPELHAHYKAEGFESIPVLSFFDSKWHELGRWMERPQSANERVAAWVAARPRIAELRGNADPAAKSELKSIFAGLVPDMADWYRTGLWIEMLDEIAAILE